jgi:hypothetical protein
MTTDLEVNGKAGFYSLVLNTEKAIAWRWQHLESGLIAIEGTDRAIAITTAALKAGLSVSSNGRKLQLIARAKGGAR